MKHIAKTVVLKGAAGCGKTEIVLKTIAKMVRGIWEYYAPTHKLAEECAARLAVMNPDLRIVVIKGRDHGLENDAPMCKKHKQAAALSKAGQSVFPHLCRQSAGKDKPVIRCDQYDQCPYIQQFAPADVYFYPHAYLPLERSILENHVPAGVVIDESYALSSVETVKFPITQLKDTNIPDAAKDVCSKLADAIMNKPDTIRNVVNEAISSGIWEKARKALQRLAAGIKPDMPEDEFNAQLIKVQNLKPVNTLFDNLHRSSHCRHPPQSIEIGSNGMVSVHHRKDILQRFNPTRPGAGPTRPPKMYVIDASASEVLMKQFIPDFEFHEIALARNAYVIQNVSGRCANSSLLSFESSDRPNAKKATGKSKAAGKQRIKDIQYLINRLHAEGRRVLAIGPSAIVGNPSKKIKALLKCPAGAESAHFNALRGVDQWKGCDTVIVIGRNQPPILEVERIARGMFFDDPTPLNLTGRWEEEERGYRYKSGKKGVDVQVHADSRVQAIVEQIRENESLQAIDRIRLIHNEQIKTVILLSNLPLDIDVDELRSWDEIIYGGNRIERAFDLQADGVLPLNAKWLATNYPKLWLTEAAAKKDVGRKKGHVPNRNNIRKMSLFKYKSASQRNWSSCLSRFDDPAIVAETLTTALGEPITAKPAQEVNETQKAA